MVPAGAFITVQKVTSSVDPPGKGIDPPTPAVVTHDIPTWLMIYKRVLGVYNKSIFLLYLKSFPPEFSNGNPYTLKAVKS